MTYAEKLKDPRWQKKRLEIMQRDNFKCKLCGDERTTLHVHHLQYKPKTEPWKYEDDNFNTYCECCHSLVEYATTFTPLSVFKIMHKDTVGLVVKLSCGSVGFYSYNPKDKEIEMVFGINQKFLSDVLEFLKTD